MDNIALKILTLPEAATFLRVSESWLYRNWRDLKGIKKAGKILFRGEKELYDSFFGIDEEENKRAGKKRKGLEIRLSAKGDKVPKSELSNQDSGQGSRGKEADRIEKPADYQSDLFNLL